MIKDLITQIIIRAKNQAEGAIESARKQLKELGAETGKT